MLYLCIGILEHLLIKDLRASTSVDAKSCIIKKVTHFAHFDPKNTHIVGVKLCIYAQLLQYVHKYAHTSFLCIYARDAYPLETYLKYLVCSIYIQVAKLRENKNKNKNTLFQSKMRGSWSFNKQ